MRIEILEELTTEPLRDGRYVAVRTLRVRNRYDDGTASLPYTYDVVDRRGMDAVAVVLHRGRGAATEVCLRACLRPPLVVRDASPVLWEVPAGILEPGEAGDAGALAAASREALEETGFALPAGAFRALGPPAHTAPGLLPELCHFAVARVDGLVAGAAQGDGSPVEERAAVRMESLKVALAMCASGEIRDLKTEVALRRLAETPRDA